MTREGIIGIILAAGKGERIRPLSTATPKPLLPVCNRAIALHQLLAMREIGIRTFRIVVSRLDTQIRQYFGDGSRFDVSILYVPQDQSLGIAHAVLRCEETIDRPFMVFLGDVYVVPRKLSRMLDLLTIEKTAAVLAVRREENRGLIRRNFTVTLSEDERVERVIEKPRHPEGNLKGCGIYLFRPVAFDSIRRTPKTAMRDEYEITSSIQILIDSGLAVRVAEVVEWDMNVTTPADLLSCNRHELDRLGLPSIVAESAEIPSGATVEGSVIGEGARILHPIALSHCLVFPNTDVDATGNLERKIITPEVTINCRSQDG